MKYFIYSFIYLYFMKEYMTVMCRIYSNGEAQVTISHIRNEEVYTTTELQECRGGGAKCTDVLVNVQTSSKQCLICSIGLILWCVNAPTMANYKLPYQLQTV